MTAYDRAKMFKRLHKAIPWLASGHPQDQDQIIAACASEVDRAVRAERKAFRDTEELRRGSRARGLVSPVAMEMFKESRRKGKR